MPFRTPVTPFQLSYEHFVRSALTLVLMVPYLFVLRFWAGVIR